MKGAKLETINWADYNGIAKEMKVYHTLDSKGDHCLLMKLGPWEHHSFWKHANKYLEHKLQEGGPLTSRLNLEDVII